MEWITKINLGEATTQSGALKVAKEIITKWCKENNCSATIHKASKLVGNHTKGRYITITPPNKRWYVYQLIISSHYKLIGKVEKERPIINFLDWSKEKKTEKFIENVYDTNLTYFARLERKCASGLDADKIEILNEVK
jgi:hypothetical protein